MTPPVQLSNGAQKLLELCQSGPTREALLEKAKSLGIERPMSALRELTQKGLVRVDQGTNGRPHRLKPTRQAQGLPPEN